MASALSALLDAYLSVLGRLVQGWARFLGRVALFATRRPYTVVALWAAVIALSLVGLLAFNQVTDTNLLWVDTEGEAAHHQAYIKSFYNSSLVYFVGITISPVHAGTDILNVKYLVQVWAIYQAIYALRTPTNNFSYVDLCYTTNLGQCAVTGIYQFWGNDYALFNASATSDFAVKYTTSQSTYPGGQPVDRALTMAHFSLINATQAAADGLAVNFLVLQNSSRTGDIGEFVALLENQIWPPNAAWPDLQVQYWYDDAVNDALTSLVGKDIKLLIIAFVAMIVFTQIFLGRPFSQLEGRSLLAMQAVLIILFSTIGAYGLCMACQVPFTTLAEVLPFLVLGVGIDNAFVVLSAVDRQDRKLDLDVRMQRAMERIGVNITVTSLVDVVALLFSLASLLPAVRYFGVYAAVSILYIYISYMTVFVACVVLDERRRARGKMDWFVCFSTRPRLETAYVDTLKRDTAMDKVDTWLQTVYAPVLLQPVTQAMVLVVFASVTGVMLWGALTKSGYDFQVEDLLPSDSSAYAYIQSFKKLFFGLPFPDNSMNLYFSGALNFSDYTVQQQYQQLVNSSQELSCMDPSASPVDWHKTMTGFGKAYPPYNAMQMDPTGAFFVGDAFYSVLHGFLASPYGPYYSNYVVLNSTTGKIILASVEFTLDFLNTSTKQVAALYAMRDLATASSLNPNVFFSSGDEPFWEQLGFMKDEATRLFSMTLVAVAIVCSIFLVHPMAILIQLVTLGMVFIDLMGALAFSGLNINSISVTNLIMAIGLVVDATVHIVRIFGVQDPKISRRDRTVFALGELGTPILLGAISLLLGVAALSSATSEVFRVFFLCFVYIVIIGWAHGLIFVPVVLSLVGPITFRDMEGEGFLKSEGGKRIEKPLVNGA